MRRVSRRRGAGDRGLVSTLPQKPSAVLIGPNSKLFGSKLHATMRGCTGFDSARKQIRTARPARLAGAISTPTSPHQAGIFFGSSVHKAIESRSIVIHEIRYRLVFHLFVFLRRRQPRSRAFLSERWSLMNSFRAPKFGRSALTPLLLTPEEIIDTRAPTPARSSPVAFPDLASPPGTSSRTGQGSSCLFPSHPPAAGRSAPPALPEPA